MKQRGPVSLSSDTLVPERSSQKWDGPQPSFLEQILGGGISGRGGRSQNQFFGGGSRAGSGRTLSSHEEEEEPAEPGGC